MILQTPRIKFIPIDLSIISIDSNNCPENVVNKYTVGGGQYCRASQRDSLYCPTGVNDINWDGPISNKIATDSPGAQKSVAPKNIVGFDLTFDK